MNHKEVSDGKKALLHSAGAIILFFAQWLISTLLVRLGGFYEAGVFSLAMSVSNVFAYFANFGIRTYMLTDTEVKYQQEMYQSASLIAIGCSYILCAGYLLIAGHYSSVEMVSIVLYLTYNNFNSFSDVLLGRIQLAGWLELNGFSNMIRGTVCFVLFIIAYLLTRDILLSMLIMVIGSFAVLSFFDAPNYRRIIQKPVIRFRPEWHMGLKVLVSCTPIMITNVIPLITTAIPRTTIQRTMGTDMLGYFSTMFTPTVLITVIVPTVMQSRLPKLSEEWDRYDRRFRKELIFCYTAVLLIAGAALIAARVIGKQVMALLFGQEILNYFNLLYWAIIVTGINAMVGVGNSILISIHNHRTIVISSIAAVVLCAIFSGIFIGRDGLYGGTMALLLSYGVQALYQIIVILREMHQHESKRVS